MILVVGPSPAFQQRMVFDALALDGKMIDMPLLKIAQKVLERAKAAGKGIR